MELRAANIIDTDIEGHFGFFPIVEQISTRLHYHDFFEVFVISKGGIQHHINGETVVLSAGHCVFIRPTDAHCFSQYKDQDCELLNIAFLQQTCREICVFLDMDTSQRRLLHPDFPSVTHIPKQELKAVVKQMEQWGRFLYRDKQESRLALRGMLANLLSNYFFMQQTIVSENIPEWLKQLCNAMEDRENIIEGREALLRLANRTPEYVGRSFKQYLGITPSKFVNDLRLDYASDLLLHSDLSPTDICYEVGFGNLSHFYHLFKARWNCSPNVFRKQNHLTLLT